MSLRDDIRDALARDDLATAEALLARHRAGLRHVTGLTYHQDPATRRRAARVIALTGKHHPKAVAEVVRRLVWAMSDEAGTNAAFAPENLRVIAEEAPQLLLPMVPDLLQLARDHEDLRDALGQTIRIVANACTGQVAKMVEAQMDPAVARAAGGRRGA